METPPSPRHSLKASLSIDLNQIPSSLPLSDSILSPFSVVRTFHGTLPPPSGPPATLPPCRHSSPCRACGIPESSGPTVVCDSCERGVHVSCTHDDVGHWIFPIDDWICSDCVEIGSRSNRWTLGRRERGVRILDINALPLSDCEGSPKHSSPSGVPMTYPNLFVENGSVFSKDRGLRQVVNFGFKDKFLPAPDFGRCFQEVDLEFPLVKLKSCNNIAGELPSQNPNETGCTGLMPTFNFVDHERVRIDAPAMLQKKLNLTRKRKSAKLSDINGFSENKDTLIGTFHNELLSRPQGMQDCGSGIGSNVKVEGDTAETNCNPESLLLNSRLPVQFENFYILSLGKVDVRPSYHDATHIWPVGYKSYWHDKITGSLFLSEVLEGGDSGPIFRVSRWSCSARPIPTGSIVIFLPNPNLFDGQNNKECGHEIQFGMGCDEDDSNIIMLLSDLCPHLTNDSVLCLNSGPDQNFDLQTSKSLKFEASVHERPQSYLRDTLEFGEEIGVFSLEGRSSSSVWGMVSNKIISSYHEIYKRGNLKFSCKHLENESCYSYLGVMEERGRINLNSLAKFFSSSESVNRSIQSENETETLLKELQKWIDQDRFGLDVEFVQEIIEQIPAVDLCSYYECLDKRSSHSTSVTVGSGLLAFKTKDGVQNQEAFSGLFRGCNNSKRQMGSKPLMVDYCPPPGKQLGSKLQPELVGDVIQVWELLWRFHDILGLNDPLSYEELVEELISPWFDGLNPPEKIEMEMQMQQILDRNSHETDGECGTENPSENSHMFMHIETEEMKEAAQARFASSTYSKCTGVSLTKAHNVLLKIVVTELKSKVAAFVDPSFDVGDLKTRRGRKKDIDNPISAKRSMLNMFQINELTWPEVARRYILSVLAMDANLDSAEITTRESGKVFRCLQGDGGVLCGSITGVAGMEADVLLLAEAINRIFGSLNKENIVLSIEEIETIETGTHERTQVTDCNIPEWVQLLEPVKKLPTNVGTRIRKCVNNALDKGPPEWAREILEHSISKEVYKGNASGPTKKAVLSVLADVYGESPLKKSQKERRKKSLVSVSEIIMKQCRIILRRAAAADNDEVFCNLLGKKLMNSNDNDDEGLLGSPAMVSRPLDFRTIDLRLAVGAYGGSHEAFLEDVRELWSAVRSVFGDQQEHIELAERLSQNFESLYKKEVLTLVDKLAAYAKSKCSTTEMKKEIDDLLACINKIPKAPWDEGICKICGIDKDDDSVLLCDTCDAEYHTYCLNPPLARIPEGNWYCPSCVAGIHLVQDSSEHTSVCGQFREKKYQGDVIRVYLDRLTHLAITMQEKEYWEFTIDQRSFLLKFLCDEFLTSAFARQHLEHCTEMTAELQQKLRSISAEWKNLKIREDFLTARAAKVGSTLPNTLEKVKTDEGLANSFSDHSNDLGHHVSIFSIDLPQRDCSQAGTLTDSLFLKKTSINYPENNSRCNTDVVMSIGTECELKDGISSIVASRSIDGPVNELTVSNPAHQESKEMSKENSFNSSMQECVEMDISTVSNPDMQEITPDTRNLLSDTRDSSSAENKTSNTMTEVQAFNLELTSTRNNISNLQDSMTNIESQLLKLPVRREFLGSDSAGRLYWVLARPSKHPVVIVDGTVAVNRNQQTNCQRKNIQEKSSVSSLGRSKTAKPTDADSAWVMYDSDAEIKELIECLKCDDPKEKELKEAIMHWQRLRFRATQDHSEPIDFFTEPPNNAEDISSRGLVTAASTLLEKKYGPFTKNITSEVLKKRGKRLKSTHGDKMYHCECLEPVWPCRPHCLSCHKTFSNDMELEGHDDGKCGLRLPAYAKSRENVNPSRGLGGTKSELTQENNIAGSSRNECSEFSSRLIRFQNEGLVCPFKFQDVTSRFVTSDSNRALVNEIGLIGSNGIPSFVPCVSPYLCDPTLMLVSPNNDAAIAVVSKFNTPSKSSTTNGVTVPFRSGKSSLKSPSAKVGHCCVVPQSSLRPLVGKVVQILRRLKINLLDMDAALPEEALKPSKVHIQRRWAWRTFIKSAETIFEMVQGTIVMEDMIRTEYLRNDWWYWSSLSAAAKTSTLSCLALRIYCLDAAIIYQVRDESMNLTGAKPDHTPNKPTNKLARRPNKRRKELDS